MKTIKSICKSSSKEDAACSEWIEIKNGLDELEHLSCARAVKDSL